MIYSYSNIVRTDTKTPLECIINTVCLLRPLAAKLKTPRKHQYIPSLLVLVLKMSITGYFHIGEMVEVGALDRWKVYVS